MNAQEIADEIDKWVRHSGGPYKKWTVGVTDNPAQRRRQHERDDEDVLWWRTWNASSEQAARSVEKHFLNNGMQGGAGGRGNADHVYVFMTP